MSTFNMAETLYDYPEGTNIQDKTSTIEDDAIIPCFDALGVVSKTTVGAVRAGVESPAQGVIPIILSLDDITNPVNGQMAAIIGAYGAFYIYIYLNSWIAIHSFGGE